MPKFHSLLPYIEIKTEAEALVLSQVIRDLGIVAFDTETTSEDPHVARNVLVSLSVPKTPWRPQWGDQLFDLAQGSRLVFEPNPVVAVPLVSMLDCVGVDVIAHNYPYDAHICWRTWRVRPGFRARVFDTLVMDHLVDENRYGRHGLKECCGDYGLIHGMKPFSTLFKKPPKGINLSPAEWAMETKREVFLDYAATDPYATLLLFYELKRRLEEQVWQDGKSLWDYYIEMEEPYVKSIWTMEHNGACVEAHALKRYEAPLKSRIQEIENFYTQRAGHVINLNSSDQLHRLFHETIGMPIVKYTDGGASGIRKASYKKEALEILEEDYPDDITPLLEHRKLSKLLSTYVEGLSSHIKSDGRVHCQFRVTGTRTGRTSSASPNLQNVENPSEDERIQQYDIRIAFKAPEGRSLVVADFSQLEVLLTAQISGDENLIKVLLEGRDLHAYTAASLFDLKYEDILEAKVLKESGGVLTSAQKKMLACRKSAKTLLFGILYGMGDKRLAANLGVTLEEARAIIDLFFKTFPGILQAKKYHTGFCKANGFVLTLLNRRRRLPEIWSNNIRASSKAERQLFNAIIQGCVEGNSRVLVEGHGYVPIKSLVNRSVRIWDGNAFVGAVVIASGMKKKILVEFASGNRIICSPEHKFLTVNEVGSERFRTALEFAPIERIKLAHAVKFHGHVELPKPTLRTHRKAPNGVGNAKRISLSAIQNPLALGIMLGRLASDGTIVRNKALTWLVAEHEISILPYMLDCLSTAGLRYRLCTRQRPNKLPMHILNLDSAVLARQATELNLKNGIPAEIFKDSELLRGFLRGMFDGDGGVTGKTIALTFGQGGRFRTYAEEIQQALLLFGIESRVHTYVDRTLVRLRTRDLHKFVQQIGFLNPAKNAKALSLLANDNVSKAFGRVEIVRSVTETEEYIEMFDVVNSDTGRFMVNGVITHNSAADLMRYYMPAITNDPVLKTMGADLVLQVHDEVVEEVPDQHAEEAKIIIVNHMEASMSHIDWRVPLKVSAKYATTWSAAK